MIPVTVILDLTAVVAPIGRARLLNLVEDRSATVMGTFHVVAQAGAEPDLCSQYLQQQLVGRRRAAVTRATLASSCRGRRPKGLGGDLADAAGSGSEQV